MNTVQFPIIDPSSPEGVAMLRRMADEQKEKKEQRELYTCIKNQMEELEDGLDYLAGCLASVAVDSEYPEAANFFRVFQVYAEKLSTDTRAIKDEIYKALYIPTLNK